MLPLATGAVWAQDADADDAGPQPFEGTEEARRYLEQAYPEAEEGMTRHVIFVEPREDESLYQVELIVGKMVMTDGVNHYFFGGAMEAEDIDGWGFSRYVVDEDAFENMASTLIGVPPGTEPKLAFVRISTPGGLVRYNSKLPIVVYVPAGGEVRYRIWQAPPQATPVLPG